MPFSYSDFVSFIKQDGLARMNRFYVDIALPSAMGRYGYRNLSLLCKGANGPMVSLSTSPVRITGEQFEIPYDRNFAPLALTFYIDREMQVRTFFDNWIHQIQSTTTRTFAYYDDFVAPYIKVHVLDKAEDVELYTITYYNVFPKTNGQIFLDHEQAGIMAQDISFDYQYYDTTGKVLDQITDISLLDADVGIAKGLAQLGGSKIDFVSSLLTGGMTSPTIFGVPNSLQAALDKAVNLGNQSLLPAFQSAVTAGQATITDGVNAIAGQAMTKVSPAVTQSYANQLFGSMITQGNSILQGTIGSMQGMANNVLNQSINAVLTGGPIPDVEAIGQAAAGNIAGAAQQMLNQSISSVLTMTNQAATSVGKQAFPPMDNAVMNGAVGQVQSFVNTTIGGHVNNVASKITTTVNKSIANIFA